MQEVDGFVLSEVSYGESSKIINILTREHGMIGVMCKGAKSLKSRYRASTMKFSYCHFNIMYKENKLSTLISGDIINHFKLIKSDILLVSFLTYLTELTSQVVKQCNVASELYDMFINTVLKLEEGIDPIVLTNILELKYLKYLGVLFNLDECALCGNKTDIATFDLDKGGYICINCLTNEVIVDKKVIKMIRMYYYVNIDTIKKIKIDDVTKNTINMYLDMYYEKYTGLYLNSKGFLNKLIKTELR